MPSRTVKDGDLDHHDGCYAAVFDGSPLCWLVPTSCDVGYEYVTVFDG